MNQSTITAQRIPERRQGVTLTPKEATLTQTIISANILTIAGVLPENNRNWSILAGLINKLEKRKSYNTAYECSQLEAELLEALLRG